MPCYVNSDFCLFVNWLARAPTTIQQNTTRVAAAKSRFTKWCMVRERGTWKISWVMRCWGEGRRERGRKRDGLSGERWMEGLAWAHVRSVVGRSRQHTSPEAEGCYMLVPSDTSWAIWASKVWVFREYKKISREPIWRLSKQPTFRKKFYSTMNIFTSEFFFFNFYYGQLQKFIINFISNFINKKFTIYYKN